MPIARQLPFWIRPKPSIQSGGPSGDLEITDARSRIPDARSFAFTTTLPRYGQFK